DIATASWFWILSNRLSVDSAVSYDKAHLTDVNHAHALLFDSKPTQYAVKQDVGYQSNGGQKFEAGYFLRRISQDGERNRVDRSTQTLVTTDKFSANAWQPGAYVQHTVTGLKSRLAFTYGTRVDHLSFTGQNVWMPRASLAFSA